MGKAEIDGDGYILNCRWAWASGSANCRWLIGGSLVTILTSIWLTSSLWFFTNIGFPGV